ncbi:hypothetical protein K443DRAFT_110098 [Laccaria amethystina LaAM-08-1]|uniref:Uncharacterized protein n=1 Tax=Laccaria amethystina LaAM-08-1 TaxID=1095629 RepID=A0A0C9XEN9_9AGAR|nr:hypothetical protein K443DRAFT_110098 [Laccaria amethystina LaAM-08-1]
MCTTTVFVSTNVRLRATAHLPVVFESLVWSGFLMLRGLNQSAFSQKPKIVDWTTKRLQTVVFCSL